MQGAIRPHTEQLTVRYLEDARLLDAQHAVGQAIAAWSSLTSVYMSMEARARTEADSAMQAAASAKQAADQAEIERMRTQESVQVGTASPLI